MKTGCKHVKKLCKPIVKALYELTDMGEVKIAHALGVSRSAIHYSLVKSGVDMSYPKQQSSGYAAELEARYGDRFSLVSLGETRRSRVTIRCNRCGAVFEHYPDWRNGVRCSNCLRLDNVKRHAAEVEARREAELVKDRTCAECGSVFHSEHFGALYCSNECRNRAKNRRHDMRRANKRRAGNHRKRTRLYGVSYEPGITLEKVIERDGNVCRICGEPCDQNDKRWGTSGPLYPSIDHVTALANGGGHTWDNVQLAHCMCNSRKRDLESEVVA